MQFTAFPCFHQYLPHFSYENKTVCVPILSQVVRYHICSVLLLSLRNISFCKKVYINFHMFMELCIFRYYAVVYPVHSRINMTDRRIRRVLLLVWLIPFICASPSLYPAEVDSHHLSSEYGKFSRKICHDE